MQQAQRRRRCRSGRRVSLAAGFAERQGARRQFDLRARWFWSRDRLILSRAPPVIVPTELNGKALAAGLFCELVDCGQRNRRLAPCRSS